LDDDGSLIYPDGHTIPHGKPLDVVEMSWEWLCQPGPLLLYKFSLTPW
jgi:hypothetical protein